MKNYYWLKFLGMGSRFKKPTKLASEKLELKIQDVRKETKQHFVRRYASNYQTQTER